MCNTCKCSLKKFDPARPVRTRNGRPARILATDRKGTWPIVALVSLSDEVEEVTLHHKDGKLSGLCENPRDLVNIPEKRNSKRKLK